MPVLNRHLLCYLLLLASLFLQRGELPAQDPGDSPDLDRSTLQERWNELSEDRRAKIRRIHQSLKSLPAKKREALVARLREVPAEEIPQVVDRLQKLLNSPEDRRGDFSRRRTAFHLWEFQLTREDREHFRTLSPTQKREHLKKMIDENLDSFIAALPEKERDRLAKLPDRDRRAAFVKRHLRRMMSMTREGHRVMHLARHLDKEQMITFIETGALVGEYPPALDEAISKLSAEQLKNVQGLLRKGKRHRDKAGYRRNGPRRNPQGRDGHPPPGPPEPGSPEPGRPEPGRPEPGREGVSPQPGPNHPGRGRPQFRRDLRRDRAYKSAPILEDPLHQTG